MGKLTFDHRGIITGEFTELLQKLRLFALELGVNNNEELDTYDAIRKLGIQVEEFIDHRNQLFLDLCRSHFLTDHFETLDSLVSDHRFFTATKVSEEINKLGLELR